MFLHTGGTPGLLSTEHADWLVAGMRYHHDDFFAAPAFRPAFIGAWVAGFALYQWLQPVGPSWWTDIVRIAHPTHFALGASLPSFALAFLLAGLAGLVSPVARAAYEIDSR